MKKSRSKQAMKKSRRRQKPNNYGRKLHQKTTSSLTTLDNYSTISSSGCFVDACIVDDDFEQDSDLILLQLKDLPYRDSFYYGPEDEQRTVIWRHGDSFNWTEKSSGVSWTGVTGLDSSYCVVSMTDKKRRSRPFGRRQLSVYDVMITALADMSSGVYADTIPIIRDYILSSEEEEPLAVVSVAPGFVEEEIALEGRPLAVRFLEKTLKSGPSVTTKEITQIAIYALKLLLGPKFKSDMIEVQASGNWEGGLGIMDEDEVDQHLAGMTASLDSLGLSSP